MSGEYRGQEGPAASSVAADRDAYAAGGNIAINNYLSAGETAADTDAAFRGRVDLALQELAEAVHAIPSRRLVA